MKMLKFNEFNMWLNEAREKKPKKNPREVPELMYIKASESGKEEEFTKFIDLLPTDAFKNIDVVFNKILSGKSTTEEFFNRLSTYKKVEEIKKGDYESGLGSIIFTAEPKGLGRGELFIAWLVKDAQISGGGESFDVQVGSNKYEVKEYSSGKDSIRLGTKGKVSRFEFWKEIVDTTRRLDKLTGYSAGKTKFDFSHYFDSEFSRVVNQILELQSKWLTGEFGKEDQSILTSFYEMANKIESKVDKDLITNVILRGPDAKPREISIEPMHSSDIQGDTITIKKTPEDHSYTYILTEMRRLKYVRDPKALMSDINSIIKTDIVGKVPFLVFRPDGPHIETDFVYDRISQSGIKIIERRLAK